MTATESWNFDSSKNSNHTEKFKNSLQSDTNIFSSKILFRIVVRITKFII